VIELASSVQWAKNGDLPMQGLIVEGGKMRLHDYLESHALQTPERARFGKRSMTYGEADTAANRLAPASGKALKKDLREPYWKGHQRRIS
jgi:hypothetical protein